MQTALSFPRSLRSIALIGGFALIIGSARADITVVNSSAKTVSADITSCTLSFDAGAAATKLVVALSDEDPIAISEFSFTYNGVPLMYVTGSQASRFRGFWYLDNPYTGGAAALTCTVAMNNNGLGFGVVSLSGAVPGEPAVMSVSSGAAVTITQVEAGSFVMVGGAENTLTSGFVNDPNLIQLYYGDIGSANGYAGYQNLVPKSSQTYTFTGTLNGWESRAIAFFPITPVTVVNSGAYRSPNDFTTSTTYSFNAGATATKLVVALSDEDPIDATAFSFTYDGVPLTRVVGSEGNRFRGFWYLDNPYTGGAAALTCTVAADNGLGIGVVSLSGAAPGGPAVVSALGSPTVTITPAAAGSFVMVGGADNEGSIVNDPDLTEIYYSDVRSAMGYAGYQNNVPASEQSYTFTGTINQWESRAIAFSPLPPSSAIQLTITPNPGNPGNYDFSWNSQAGKVYDLVSSTDLAGPISLWPVWQGNTGIAPSGSGTNALTNVPGGGGTKRFFAVVERDP